MKSSIKKYRGDYYLKIKKTNLY
ncbi:hypothetical protein NMF93_09535 [Clostridioides difficile]|nr:hypothetical protein [Clostridioides difficile]